MTSRRSKSNTVINRQIIALSQREIDVPVGGRHGHGSYVKDSKVAGPRRYTVSRPAAGPGQPAQGSVTGGSEPHPAAQHAAEEGVTLAEVDISRLCDGYW